MDGFTSALGALVIRLLRLDAFCSAYDAVFCLRIRITIRVEGDSPPSLYRKTLPVFGWAVCAFGADCSIERSDNGRAPADVTEAIASGTGACRGSEGKQAQDVAVVAGEHREVRAISVPDPTRRWRRRVRPSGPRTQGCRSCTWRRAAPTADQRPW